MTFNCTYSKLQLVKHWAAILLILSFAAIGSGAMEFVHNLAHAAEDALEDRAGMLDVLRSHHIGGIASEHTPADHHHDESNCQLHAQLHLPIMTGGFVSLLVCLGLWVAFLTQLPHLVIRRLHFPHFDSRGPPLTIA